MAVAILPALSAGGMVLSAMASAVKALYGMAVNINDYLDDHIKDMKGSDNPTISRSGRILEMAKLGFGIGYITPVVVISVGQLLLGNTLSAITTIATAATLTNPIAMTCAAIGAIYYGWGALSDTEREEMLAKLSAGLEVGIELIKSIVRFVVEKIKELLSSKNIEEIKKYIGSAAAVFGKSLSDVTHKFTDVVSGSFDAFKKTTSSAMERTFDVATDAYEGVGSGVDMLKGKVGDAVIKTKMIASDALQTASSTVAEAAKGIQTKLEKTGQDSKNDRTPAKEN